MNIQRLIDAGIDYHDGLRRFKGKVDRYERLLNIFVKDTTFAELKQAINTSDYITAFQCAHTLKGVVGNLSFNEFFKLLNPFVEALRNNSNVPLAIELFPNLEDNYTKIINAINYQD